MVTKAYRLKENLTYHPVPWHITGRCAIAKYIREQFNTTYYLSRVLADYVHDFRQEERERLKERKRKCI